MNITKLFTGGIVGGIVFFLLGYLFYGLLFADFMASAAAVQPKASGVMRSMEKLNWLGLILGNLFAGFLIAYVLLKSNVTTLAGGLVTGAIVGFLMSSSVDLTSYGVTYINRIKGVMADVAIFTAMSAISGAIVGLVVGRGAK